MQNNKLPQVPEIQRPQEETTKRARMAGKVIVVLLAHWKTNFMLGIVVWLGWKEKFWRDPLYRFTFPLLFLLCSLPLLDGLLKRYRERSAVK